MSTEHNTKLPSFLQYPHQFLTQPAPGLKSEAFDQLNVITSPPHSHFWVWNWFYAL